MALPAATRTKYIQRWGEDNLAQLTQGDNYVNDQTIDEDVLESTAGRCQLWVQQKIGPVDADHFGVIEIFPFVIRAPGDLSDEEQNLFQATLDRLTPQSAAAQTNAIEKGEDGDKRRYDGEDFLDDLDTQSSARARRSYR